MSGFTATPFANIFIDPASTHDMLGDDLFPSDFIHVLEAPNNYVGMNRLFRPTDPDDLDDDRFRSPMRTIEDEHLWLPPDHINFTEVHELSDSLLTALRAFLLAMAIRDLRAARGEEGAVVASIGPCCQCLAVHRCPEPCRGRDPRGTRNDKDSRPSVRQFAIGRSRAVKSRNSRTIRVFADEFTGSGLAWEDVLAALHEAIAPVLVQPVNQSRERPASTIRKTRPGCASSRSVATVSRGV